LAFQWTPLILGDYTLSILHRRQQQQQHHPDDSSAVSSTLIPGGGAFAGLVGGGGAAGGGRQLEHISGSPFAVTVGASSVTLGSLCDVHGQGLHSTEAGDRGTFTVVSKDRFGNRRSAGGEAFAAFLDGGGGGGGGEEGSAVEACSCVDRRDGSYVFSYCTAGTSFLCIGIVDIYSSI
jgi:hypothetical protein